MNEPWQSASTDAPHESDRIVVLGGTVEEDGPYGWLLESGLSWQCVTATEDWMPDERTRLIVTHRHYTPAEVDVLQRVLAAGQVPILILMDGILEFRNTWRHPQLPIGTFLHPAIGHKIACLGSSQSRWLESWGNAGKCEIVGLPRLDGWAERCREFATTGADSTPFRLLIASARRIGFTSEQSRDTIEIFRQLRERLRQRTQVGGRELDVRWRVSDELADAISLTPDTNRRSESLAGEIGRAQAILTTPSTLMLEGMLAGKPVAAIDPHNVPVYVPTAWTIRRADDFDRVVSDMQAADPALLAFQHQTLRDAYQTNESATQRMRRLVERLIEAAAQLRSAGRPLCELGPLLEPAGESEVEPHDANPLAPTNRRIAQARRHWSGLGDEYPDLSEQARPAEALAVAALRVQERELTEANSTIRSLEAQLRQAEHAQQQVERLTVRVQETTERAERAAARNRGLHRRLLEANGRIDQLRNRLGLPPIDRPALSVDHEQDLDT